MWLGIHEAACYRKYAEAFHPVTLETGSEEQQLSELLMAIEQRTDFNFLITKSNACIGGGYVVSTKGGKCIELVWRRENFGSNT